MKYENTHYYEAPRIFWPSKCEVVSYDHKKHRVVYENTSGKYKEYHALSVSAKWLYQTLKECEHRYTGKENNRYHVIYEGVENSKNWFYVGGDKLAFMSGMCKRTCEKAKKELVKAGIIRTCRVHFRDKKTGRRSSWHLNGYYVLAEYELGWEKIIDDNDEYFDD